MNGNIYNRYQLAFLRKMAEVTATDETIDTSNMSGNTDRTTGTATVAPSQPVRQSLTKHPISLSASKIKDTGFEIQQIGSLGTGAVNGYMLGKNADFDKLAAAFGSGGWLWDSDQGFEGNLSGYGGAIGQIGGTVIGGALGGAGGATVGTFAAPGVGTAAGGVAGTAAGGAAGGLAGGVGGRGLGGAIGKGLDYMFGTGPAAGQPSLLQRTFNTGSMASDALWGTLPGIGKGLQFGGRVLPRVARAMAPGSKITPKQAFGRAARQFESQIMQAGERMGMKAYKPKPGNSFNQNLLGRAKNTAANVIRPFKTKAGLMQAAKTAIPVSALGVGANLLGDRMSTSKADPRANRREAFTNTQGYTNVVGNTHRGFQQAGMVG